MTTKLVEMFDKIRENKRKGQSCCSNCGLLNDYGPALIDCADASPEIVVVSESPMSKPELLGKIDAWICDLMRQCCEGSHGDLSSARTMGEFMGRLSRGRVYNASDETRTRSLYWTHTVKCFLQNEENKQMPFRTRKDKIGIREMRKLEFKSAIKKCSMYLPNEIEAIDPKLVIAVGISVAGKTLRKLMEPRFAERLCEVYHPGAQQKREKKQEKINALSRKVKDVGLTGILYFH
jgi:uracil-DNA glycosylase